MPPTVSLIPFLFSLSCEREARELTKLDMGWSWRDSFPAIHHREMVFSLEPGQLSEDLTKAKLICLDLPFSRPGQLIQSSLVVSRLMGAPRVLYRLRLSSA
ncbi:hypothetical protein C7212DRAFT_314646, partial [Tuber magnatum]